MEIPIPLFRSPVPEIWQKPSPLPDIRISVTKNSLKPDTMSGTVFSSTTKPCPIYSGKKQFSVRRNQQLPNACRAFQPGDRRNIQQRSSADLALSNRRDDRAMMTQKSRDDVNFRSRVPGFSSQRVRGRAAPCYFQRLLNVLQSSLIEQGSPIRTSL